MKIIDEKNYLITPILFFKKTCSSFRMNKKKKGVLCGDLRDLFATLVEKKFQESLQI